MIIHIIFLLTVKDLQPHHLPHGPICHLYRPYENEHIENQLSDIAPHHSSSCRSGIHHRGRGCKGGENHAGQNDDGSFQADGSVAFEKALANALGRFPGKGGQGNGGNGCVACGVAVGLYFLLKPHLGTETVSWVCILGAAPFAALGFVKYNGMTAEKFLWAFIKSEFLMPKKLVFHSTNTYYELMKPIIENKQKEAYKNND